MDTKKIRIVLLIVFALVMFSSIQLQIDIFTFVTLFVIAPVVIYLVVKKIFPKGSDIK